MASEMVGTSPAIEQASDRTLVGIFFRQAERLGARPFVHFHEAGSWRSLSWEGFGEQVLKVASALVGAGVEAGQRVLLMSPNRVEWLICDLGIQAAGAVTVPVYPNTTAATAQGIARDCAAPVAIVSEAAATRLRIEGELDRILQIEQDVAGWLRGESSPQAEAEVRRRMASLKPDGVCSIIYTSGTSGEPKGVVLLHRNFADMARNSLESFRLDESDIYLSFLPYAHVFERVSGIAVSMVAGSTVYVSSGIARLSQELGEVRPTVMCSVPRVYEKMHAAVGERLSSQPAWRQALFRWAMATGRNHLPDDGEGPAYRLADRLVLSALRRRLTGGRLRFFVSGGAPLSLEIEEFFWAAGIRILQGWGLTETSSGACSNTLERHRFGTVGWPLQGMELRIAGDGEILVRGEGVMAGYHNNPEATAEILEEGWLRTGDIGELEADGCLRITDRKKDLIKTAGGKYVAPQPLEAQLQEDPLIERAILIGDQRPYVVALVVPDWAALRTRGLHGQPERLIQDSGVVALIQERIDAINRELARHETIKQFRLLPGDFNEESGELTPTLKIRRRVIQQHHQDLIEAMYQVKGRPERG